MAAVVEVAAPPEVPPAASQSLLGLLVPIAMLGVTGAAFLTGTARHPAFVAVPAMMSVSVLVTALTGRGRRRSCTLNAARDHYFGYLSRLREAVTETAVAQHSALIAAHPDPETLWTLIGGTRMWARRPDPELSARIGIGSVALATPLAAAQTPQRCDPISAAAQQRFLRAHSTTNAPLVIRLAGKVTIDGDEHRVRDLLRAMICRLAVTHSPDQLLIAGIFDHRNRMRWDWLKWLPHHTHPDGIGRNRAVVVIDTAQPVDGLPTGVTLLEVGTDRPSLTVRHCDGIDVPELPDRLSEADALACARRLAAHGGSAPRSDHDWASMLGIGSASDFAPDSLWRNTDPRAQLCVPIGTAPDGQPVHLDIKEPAQQGMGPHGLCVGATGSGKSELLRTVALGMMARNSPEVLNLLLIDFKGGATFLDFSKAPHVTAVVTNLADEAPLVARMRDALAGEMNRRQQLLRAAGAVSVAAYHQTCVTERGALPALFIIVDEFSELLGQHPDFADTFVAIGRLGRSLGIHLLLASQRLDEGRLRGLEAHLSYRICLKTLSASESRTVLGTVDAYELPAAPGAGLLRIASGVPVRFQAAYVSGPLQHQRLEGPSAVGGFTMHAEMAAAQTPAEASVMHTVLDRLAGQGTPAHQVWLPPLDVAPALGALLNDDVPTRLTVPIGVIDRPFHQTREPLLVDLSGAAGNVAVVGGPRSGKSTALCTLITALAVTHEPGQVQFYGLDFGGGALSALRHLPHMGDVADRAAPELVRRMVGEIESAVRVREAHGRASAPELFFVVDGWARLRYEFEELEDTITAIAGQGLSFGVHVMLTASRWAELRPALKDQVGTRIELRLGDPADSELDRRQARHVPVDRPGRGLSRDGSHMMIAVPDGVQSRCGVAAAPIPLLPTMVGHAAVVADASAGVTLGIEERGLHPVTIDFGRNRHLLIFGDKGCGKTAALRLLCREIVRTQTPAQARLFIVDFRRTLIGIVDSEHLGGYAMAPSSLGAVLPPLIELLRGRMPGVNVSQAQLKARSWWTGPDIYLVVDDYDLVVESFPELAEYLPYAMDLGLSVILARRSGGGARALYEPLPALLHDLGCMALVMSGRPQDGPLLGTRSPRPLPPGRGMLMTNPGDEQLVQVAWSPPA